MSSTQDINMSNTNTPQPYGGEPGNTGTGAGLNQNTTSTPAASTQNVGGTGSTTGLPAGQTQTPASSTGRTTRSQSALNQQSQNSSTSGAGTGAGVPGGRKDTGGRVEPAEEEGGAARGTGTAPTGDAAGSGAPSKDVEPEGGYPEQMHAGKLEGYGPEYGEHTKVTIADRAKGVKEQIIGTVKKDQGLKHQGHERMTGELKRKEIEKEQSSDPFSNADGGKKEDKDESPESDAKKTRTEQTDEPGLTEQPHAHPTEQGRAEQAGSVHPEGSAPSGLQQDAKANAESAQIN